MQRVLAAAARIADPADPLGREARARLPAASGLTPEGVELALATALERHASADERARLVAAAGDARRCWVVASANVCTAAARAIALGVAAAPEVRVRPSRRDAVVAELLVRALAADPVFDAAGGHVELVEQLAAAPGEAVHAYGSDATMRAIAADLPEGVIFRPHGTGIGVAVVSASDDLARAAEAIAADVAIFDQRGCLSPRVVAVDGPRDRAGRLGALVDAALARWHRLVPRAPLDAAVAAELARWTRTLEAMGDVASGPGHAVAVLGEAGSLPLGPAARALLILPGEVAVAVLAAHGRHVAALGRDDPASASSRALSAIAAGARTARLGHMQRPPLDGPVDVR